MERQSRSETDINKVLQEQSETHTQIIFKERSKLCNFFIALTQKLFNSIS